MLRETIFQQKVDLKYAIAIVITICFFVLFFVWHFSTPKQNTESAAPVSLSKEEIRQQQLKELENLRRGVAAATKKEHQSQLKKLEKLSSPQTEFLSHEETQKQLEQLNKLRSE